MKNSNAERMPDDELRDAFTAANKALDNFEALAKTDNSKKQPMSAATIPFAGVPLETYILGPKVVLDRWSHEDSRELVDRLQACQQLCWQDTKLVFKTLVDDLAIVSKYTRLVNFVINDKLGKTMKLGYNFLNVHDCWPAHWNMAGDTGEGIRLLSPMYYLDMDAVRAGDGWPNPVDLGARLADSMLDPGSPNQITADSRGYYYWSGMMANFSLEDYFVKFFLYGHYARFTKFKAEAQPAADKEILGIVSEALEPQAHSILAADLPWAQ